MIDLMTKTVRPFLIVSLLPFMSMAASGLTPLGRAVGNPMQDQALSLPACSVHEPKNILLRLHQFAEVVWWHLLPNYDPSVLGTLGGNAGQRRPKPLEPRRATPEIFPFYQQGLSYQKKFPVDADAGQIIVRTTGRSNLSRTLLKPVTDWADRNRVSRSEIINDRWNDSVVLYVPLNLFQRIPDSAVLPSAPTSSKPQVVGSKGQNKTVTRSPRLKLPTAPLPSISRQDPIEEFLKKIERLLKHFEVSFRMDAGEELDSVHLRLKTNPKDPLFNTLLSQLMHEARNIGISTSFNSAEAAYDLYLYRPSALSFVRRLDGSQSA